MTIPSAVSNPATKLQQTIQQAIPLSQQMGYEITKLSATQISVTAPLKNNVNIHGTAFAGSIYSIATLTAWALVYHILQITAANTELVLGTGQIQYRTPIRTDLQCSAEITEQEKAGFLNRLKNKGHSRIIVTVNINDAAYWEGKLSAIMRQTA